MAVVARLQKGRREWRREGPEGPGKTGEEDREGYEGAATECSEGGIKGYRDLYEDSGEQD